MVERYPSVRVSSLLLHSPPLHARRHLFFYSFFIQRTFDPIRYAGTVCTRVLNYFFDPTRLR